MGPVLVAVIPVVMVVPWLDVVVCVVVPEVVVVLSIMGLSPQSTLSS